MQFTPFTISSLRPKVDFLHRTVRDFMQAPSMQKRFEQLNADGFSANRTLCMSFLAQIKSLDSISKTDVDTSKPHRAPFSELLQDLVYYARRYERENEKSLRAILDEMDRSATALFKAQESEIGQNGKGHWTRIAGYRSSQPEFLKFALRAGLLVYVTETVKMWGSRLGSQGASLLTAALTLERMNTDDDDERKNIFLYHAGPSMELPSLDLIDQLLIKGVNLSTVSEGPWTVWPRFLELLAFHFVRRRDTIHIDRWAATTRLFVSQLVLHKQSPNIQLPFDPTSPFEPTRPRDRKWTAVSFLEYVFSPEVMQEIKAMGGA